MMLDQPQPITSTFIVGIAFGVCLALIASWVWRRWHTRAAFPRAAGTITDVLPPELDAGLRAKSRAFAEATGSPAAAPFVYSAIRDLALVRGHHTRAFKSEDEVEP
jgi:hypothetical protein